MGKAPSHSEAATLRGHIARCAKECGVSAAAQQFAVSMQTVRNACREHNVVVDRANNVRKIASATTFVILKQLLDGVRPADIAKQFRVSPQRVSEIKVAAMAAGFVFGGLDVDSQSC
jgi:hypothetical protein